MDTPRHDTDQKKFITALKWPFLAVLVLLTAHLLRLWAGIDGGDYGVIPRTNVGFRGIWIMPLVHGDWTHLLANSVPLFALTALLVYFYPRVAGRSFWMIYFGTGILVWIFARPVSHIGASGVVYGLVSFLFWNGIFRRSRRAIILALTVLLFYSGMFAGILPDQPGVSWEAHLLGSLTGIIAAFWYKGELEDDEIRPAYQGERRIKIHFLPADIFEKTKAQRIAEAEEAARTAAAEMYRRWLEEQMTLRQQQQIPPFPPSFWTFTST